MIGLLELVRRAIRLSRNSSLLRAEILEMANRGDSPGAIARSLNVAVQRVSYHINTALDLALVERSQEGKKNNIRLTDAGVNFVASQKKIAGLLKFGNARVVRLENARYNATIQKMDHVPPWHAKRMRNWTQYEETIDGVYVTLNYGTNPSIDFVAPPAESSGLIDCLLKSNMAVFKVVLKIQNEYGLVLSELHFGKGSEWSVSDTFARGITQNFGQVTVTDVGKFNASPPNRWGEIEFFDLDDAVQYMRMPRLLAIIEERTNSIRAEMVYLGEKISRILEERGTGAHSNVIQEMPSDG